MSARRTKPLEPGRTEAQVLREVLKTLAKDGIKAIHRNTGGMLNAGGQYVRFGKSGDPDISEQIPAGWGPASGKLLDIEVKREDFDPAKLRGKKREHFDRQLARLKLTNANGGYGVWVTDPSQVQVVLGMIREGCRIVFHGDYPYLTDEVS